MQLANNMILKIKILSLISVISLSTLLGCGGGSSSSKGEASPSPQTDGKGGSTARFSLIGDYLYTISGNNLQLFNLATDPAVPSVFANVYVGWDIETLYSTDKHLFVGASNGVYIFDNSDKSNPIQVSKFLHVRSCDPVVVSNNFAYVTLRNGGGRCGQGENKMDVLDVSDIFNPVLIKTYAMQSPKGLGVFNDSLFVCDDVAGLKIYNIADRANPKLSSTETSINCSDLIPYQKNLNQNKNQNGLVISDESGILQFNYGSEQLTKVSEIMIKVPEPIIP